MEWIQKIDFAVLDWIQQHIKGDFLDFLMPLITALGNGGIFFGLLAVFLLCRKKYRRAGIALLGGLTFCLIFGNLLLQMGELCKLFLFFRRGWKIQSAKK